MARSSARRSPCQNLHDGKDELAGGTPTKGSDRRTPTPAATRAPTPVAVPIVAWLAISGSADSSVVRYLEDNLQRIFKTVLDSRPPAPIPTPVVAGAPYSEGSRERPLKARFPDIYWGKSHLEYYNFFQRCKDHFATAGATGLNQVPFAATFLKDTVLFQWQQHQRKIEDQINAPIIWERFKAFFCQSLGESEAFVDTIWSTIRKDSQHQLQTVINWAAHLEYLQTVFWEFDANAVISEPVLIRLFRDGLRPSIRAQAKQEGRRKDIYDEAIKKAITVEAKAALNLPSWACEMDVCCRQDHRSASKPTKDYTRDQGSLPFRPQEARIMPPHRSKRAETLERPRRDHQKGRHDRNRPIAVPAALGLKAPSRPLGSTQLRLRLKMIVATTSQHVGKIGT